MKAVVCEKPYSIGIVDRPEPVRTAGELLVRVRRVGLCGTDFHIVAGRHPFLAYPRVIGHELAGEVVAADASSPIRPGQTITINPYLACGRCIACRKQKPNCCVNIEVLGVHTDGGMAEFICVPQDVAVAADGLTLDQAAMVEFLAIGAHAVRQGAVSEGERVLVTGAGPIGVAVALFAARRGADVTLIDINSKRLEYARERLGITQTVTVSDELEPMLSERTDGEFFDVVFDATGSARAIENGFRYVAHGGRYVLVSVVKDMIHFSDPEFHKREATLIASRNATAEDFGNVIESIRKGQVPTDALHTHTFSLMELPSKMMELLSRQDQTLKVICEV